MTGLPQEVLQPEHRRQKQSAGEKSQVHVSHGGEDQRNAKLLWFDRDRPPRTSDSGCDEGAEMWRSRCGKLQLLLPRSVNGRTTPSRTCEMFYIY